MTIIFLNITVRKNQHTMEIIRRIIQTTSNPELNYVVIVSDVIGTDTLEHLIVLSKDLKKHFPKAEDKDIRYGNAATRHKGEELHGRTFIIWRHNGPIGKIPNGFIVVEKNKGEAEESSIG